MGVDCEIRLPELVRVDDVAEVMGILAGLPFRWEKSSDGHAQWIRVEGVEVKPSSVVGLADIHLATKPDSHYVLYHFQPGGDGGRLMLPPSTAFWISIAKGLVKFFGGTVDYQDCDRVQVDYKKPTRLDLHIENDGAFDALHKAMAKLKPLTKEQIAANDRYAAYKLD